MMSIWTASMSFGEISERRSEKPNGRRCKKQSERMWSFWRRLRNGLTTYNLS